MKKISIGRIPEDFKELWKSMTRNEGKYFWVNSNFETQSTFEWTFSLFFFVIDKKIFKVQTVYWNATSGKLN